jgi:hypothetical protein
MFKVNIVDHSTREVIPSFKPADLKDLPSDLIDFIRKLPKGDKLKPMETDTIQLSTYKTPERKIYGCYKVPEERNVEVMLPRDNNCSYYACLTDNKEKLAQDPQTFFPISVKGLKDSIRRVFKTKEYFDQNVKNGVLQINY